MTPLLCNIYRCAKKEGMYVYMDKKTAIDTLPEALIKRTGKMTLAMSLLLSDDKKLARANAVDVLTAIENQGFYLQMPPSPEIEAQAAIKSITEANNFLEK